MTVKRRWMRNVLTQSAAVNVHLPWERGLRREASFALRRNRSPVPVRRRA